MFGLDVVMKMARPMVKEKAPEIIAMFKERAHKEEVEAGAPLMLMLKFNRDSNRFEGQLFKVVKGERPELYKTLDFSDESKIVDQILGMDD